jgi:AcrR family transcriptional regulator
MPRRAKLRPDEPGRDKVLEAGRELFGSRGYDATSIAEIGERAGIAKSVLYHYFGSKAALYEAIIEAETRALLLRVRSAVPADPGAPRLRAGVDAYLEFLAERPSAWRLLLREAPADPALLRVHQRLARERSDALAELLARPAKHAQAQPQVELVAMAIRAFAGWWYDHREVPRARLVDAITDVARAGATHLADTARPAGR